MIISILYLFLNHYLFIDLNLIGLKPKTRMPSWISMLVYPKVTLITGFKAAKAGESTIHSLILSLVPTLIYTILISHLSNDASCPSVGRWLAGGYTFKLLSEHVSLKIHLNISLCQQAKLFLKKHLMKFKNT